MPTLEPKTNPTPAELALDELVEFVRETVPQPKAILDLKIQNPPGVATFRWHQREFVVRPSLQVFELRGKDLFVTGSSMLIQTALLRKSKTSKVLEAAVETLHQVEDFFKGRANEKGVMLLATVKKTLASLASQ